MTVDRDALIRGIVKGLEWKEYPEQGFWRADTALGEYSVGFDDGWWAQLEGVEFWNWETPEDPRCYSGPESGMNACFADYRARIAAALDMDALVELVEVLASAAWWTDAPEGDLDVVQEWLRGRG